MFYLKTWAEPFRFRGFASRIARQAHRRCLSIENHGSLSLKPTGGPLMAHTNTAAGAIIQAGVLPVALVAIPESLNGVAVFIMSYFKRFSVFISRLEATNVRVSSIKLLPFTRMCTRSFSILTGSPSSA